MRCGMGACFGCALWACVSSTAVANVALLSQQRSITAATSSNGNSQTLAAPDFSPFVQTLTLTNTFAGVAGPITNTATSRIDCQIDPNAIRANGTLAGAGGVAALTSTTEIGDARASIFVLFQVDADTPFSLLASPNPAVHPTDDFILELKNLTTNTRLIRLEQSDAPQQVDLSGLLQPGQYSFTYRVETTVDGQSASRDYALSLVVPSPAAGSLLGLFAVGAFRRRR